MNVRKMIGLTAFATGALSGITPVSAAPINVGLELMLLVDVSGSVDATEYALQKTGYVNAFNNPAVQAAIMASQGGGIAVTYIEWSGNNQQSQKVGWTLINNAASASAFAAALAGVTRTYSGNTAIQEAIGTQYSKFGTETGGTDNGFLSLRQVIDVSGDGADNDSNNPFTTCGSGRNAALGAGVDTVNGIAILGETGLANYYQNCVTGGANAFTQVATSFASFGDANQQKLTREITGNVPLPGSVALLGMGLLGVGISARRRSQAC